MLVDLKWSGQQQRVWMRESFAITARNSKIEYKRVTLLDSLAIAPVIEGRIDF